MFDTDWVSTREQLLGAKLWGTAERFALDRDSIGEAVAALRELAHPGPPRSSDRRTRRLAPREVDGRMVLTETAGVAAGAWLASPSTSMGTELFIAGLCIYAGVNHRDLARWVQVGLDRGHSSLRPAHGTDLWDRPIREH